jgi:hypothetical protein
VYWDEEVLRNTGYSSFMINSRSKASFSSWGPTYEGIIVPWFDGFIFNGVIRKYIFIGQFSSHILSVSIFSKFTYRGRNDF